MRNAVCPGSFDPVTNGHLDVFERASAMYDNVTVAVLTNSSKSALFSVEERINFIAEACSKWSNIKVVSFQGLLVDF
ncbi:MAG: adenylyltransferase/cytidyltransferase family protein, partial [Actinobacteria bacterium]|nr:adenylyltransferase/cytidyltransferase family protein [Actinomycetota bacterium]